MKAFLSLLALTLLVTTRAAPGSLELESDEVLPLAYSAGPALVSSSDLYTAVFPFESVGPVVEVVDQVVVPQFYSANYGPAVIGSALPSQRLDQASVHAQESLRLKRKQAQLKRQQHILRQQQVLLQQQLQRNEQQYLHQKNQRQQQLVQQKVQQQHFGYPQPQQIRPTPLVQGNLIGQRLSSTNQLVQTPGGTVQELVPIQPQQQQQQVVTTQAGVQNPLPVATPIQTQSGPAVLVQGVALQPVAGQVSPVGHQQPLHFQQQQQQGQHFSQFNPSQQQQQRQHFPYVPQPQQQLPAFGGQHQQQRYPNRKSHTGFSQQNTAQFYSQDVDDVVATAAEEE